MPSSFAANLRLSECADDARISGHAAVFPHAVGESAHRVLWLDLADGETLRSKVSVSLSVAQAEALGHMLVKLANQTAEAPPPDGEHHSTAIGPLTAWPNG